jgi:hypothetical protein
MTLIPVGVLVLTIVGALDDYLAVQPGAAVLVRGVWTEGSLLVASELKALSGVPGPAEREGL